MEAAAAAWDALDDPYLRARAADLRSVGDQVLRHLLGSAADVWRRARTNPAPGAPGIVVAPDLSPAEAAGLDPADVLGVACAFGGPTSHGAILARSLGIPAVVGAGRALLGVVEGTLLALDGEAGTVTVDPPAATVRALEARRAGRARDEAEAQARAHAPAVTRDGVLVHVEANVAGPQDIGPAVAAGADGVGLLRTEFLFLAADHLPTEDEQERAYRAVAEGLGGRPLTLRTLDVGADKPLPYLPLERERNPNLGLRGIRLGLRHPEVLHGPAARGAAGGRGPPAPGDVPDGGHGGRGPARPGDPGRGARVSDRGGRRGAGAHRGRDHGRGPRRRPHGRGVRAARGLLLDRAPTTSRSTSSPPTAATPRWPPWPTRFIPPCSA